MMFSKKQLSLRWRVSNQTVGYGCKASYDVKIVQKVNLLDENLPELPSQRNRSVVIQR